jgi:2-polyprenyl-3-methyl-5-hydroxy-6-metoxy-1,4-benzoquinol methylase
MSQAVTSKDYRERIYGEYVSSFKGRRTREQSLTAARKHCRFFDHLLSPLMAAGRPRDVLEVACGPGHFLYWARERGLDTVRGFDLSAEQVEAARALGLPAEAASFQDYLPRHRDAFDLIVGFDVVEHLRRDELFEFLDMCHGSLRPNGRLFLTTPNGAGLRGGPVMYGDLTHETIFTPQTITLALRLAAFDDIRVREVSPPPISARGRVRGWLWRLVRLWPMLVDLVETGGCSGRIYSRVMAVQARRGE